MGYPQTTFQEEASSLKWYEFKKQKYFAYCFYCAQQNQPIKIPQQQQQQQQQQQHQHQHQHQQQHIEKNHCYEEDRPSNIEVAQQQQQQQHVQAHHTLPCQQHQDTCKGWQTNASNLNSMPGKENWGEDRRPVEIRSAFKSRIGSRTELRKSDISQQIENNRLVC